MAINYFEANVIPKKKMGKMLYGVVECKNLVEARRLFKLLDETMDWRFVEGLAMNGTKITVTFFKKKEEKKNVNSKKKMS